MNGSRMLASVRRVRGARRSWMALLLAGLVVGALAPVAFGQAADTPPAAVPEPPAVVPEPPAAIPGALAPGDTPLPKRSYVEQGPDGSFRVTVMPSAKRLDPVAVPDALCTGGSTAACREVVEIIRNNFRISGYFEVVPPQAYVADMQKESLTNTQWADWNNVGAIYLVKVEVGGNGPFDVDFRFYNVIDKRTYTVGQQQRRGLARDGLRPAVHDFMNELIGQITGEKGVFGTRILYSVRQGLGARVIGVTDMDGFGEGVAVSGGSINMLPNWAPGGGVMYTSFRSGKPDIWVGKSRLSQDGHHYRRARFAPGGGKIAVSVNVGDQSDIFLMSPDGTLGPNLTNHWADDVSPTWSPDGSRIAFVSNRSGGPQVYVMNADGSDQRRVTMAGSYNSTPDWGKNGLIVFAGMDEGTSDIFTVSLDGVITRLTQDQGFNKDPAWAPNGRYVTFISDREGGDHLYIMTDDGRYQFRIGKSGGVATPAWQM